MYVSEFICLDTLYQGFKELEKMGFVPFSVVQTRVVHDGREVSVVAIAAQRKESVGDQYETRQTYMVFGRQSVGSAEFVILKDVEYGGDIPQLPTDEVTMLTWSQAA